MTIVTQKTGKITIPNWGKDEGETFKYNPDIKDIDILLSQIGFYKEKKTLIEGQFQIDIKTSYEDSENVIIIFKIDDTPTLSFITRGSQERIECLKFLTDIAYKMKSIAHMNKKEEYWRQNG